MGRPFLLFWVGDTRGPSTEPLDGRSTRVDERILFRRDENKFLDESQIDFTIH